MPLSRRVIRSTTTYIGGGASPPPPPPPPTGGTLNAFAVFGDSMAQGAGAGNPNLMWHAVLADLIGSYTGTRPIVYRFGIGGSRLGTHAQRQGGAKMTVTVAGGQIPTSGAVNLTPADPEFDLAESGPILDFQLAGVTGTVRRASLFPGAALQFTRNVTGPAVPAPGWQLLRDLAGEAQRGIPHLFWTPHNNRAEALGPYQDRRVAPLAAAPYVVNTMAAMKSYNTDPSARVAFLGLSSGPTVTERVGGNPTGAFDSEYTEIFGTTGYGGATADIMSMAGASRWVDVRAGLISLSVDPDVSAYARAGLTPTSADVDCASAGKRYPGPSLRPAGDGVGHLNPAGQAWIAHAVFTHMLTQAWFI